MSGSAPWWALAIVAALYAPWLVARLLRRRKPRPVTLTLDEILETDKKLRMLGGFPLEGAAQPKRQAAATKTPAAPTSSGDP